MDMFYELAAGTVENHDEEWVRAKRKLYSKRIEDACTATRSSVEKTSRWEAERRQWLAYGPFSSALLSPQVRSF